MMRAGKELVPPPDLARLATAFDGAAVLDRTIIREELAKLAAYLADLEARLKVHDYANMRFA